VKKKIVSDCQQKVQDEKLKLSVVIGQLQSAQESLKKCHAQVMGKKGTLQRGKTEWWIIMQSVKESFARLVKATNKICPN
jgi:hypothetical protein